MHASGAVINGQSFPRPSLFGVAELDNVVAEGGLAYGAIHVLEAVSSTSMTEAALHAQAVAAFATGFGARSGASACWLGPPPDLLSPFATLAPDNPDGWRKIETHWDSPRAPDLSAIAGDVPRVVVLDARQAYRLAPPVSLARRLARQGRVVVFLAHDATGVVARLERVPVSRLRQADQNAPDTVAPDAFSGQSRSKIAPGVPATCWRIGQVLDGAAGEAARSGLWRVELVRSDSIRRIVVSACDVSGRMSAAPRDMQGRGKEMARRFASIHVCSV